MGEVTMKTEVLERLWDVICERKKNPKEGSYTRKMFEDPKTLYEKILEESQEVVEAAKSDRFRGKDSLSWEMADLLYHLMVLSALKEQDFDSVLSELESRMK